MICSDRSVVCRRSYGAEVSQGRLSGLALGLDLAVRAAGAGRDSGAHSGPVGAIRLGNPLLKSMSHAAGQSAHAQIGSCSRYP